MPILSNTILQAKLFILKRAGDVPDHLAEYPLGYFRGQQKALVFLVEIRYELGPLGGENDRSLVAFTAKPCDTLCHVFPLFYPCLIYLCCILLD